MAIKKKKPLVKPDLKYCKLCEAASLGMYCTGKCKKEKK